MHLFKIVLSLLVVASHTSIHAKPGIIMPFIKKGKHDMHSNSLATSIPVTIVYDDTYNISFWYLERLHPFDAAKYGRVHTYLAHALKKRPDLQKHCSFRKPWMVTDDQLRLVHTQEYLDSLRSSAVVARITEIPVLRMLPNFVVRRKVLNPMKMATGGTIMGAELALKTNTCVINLSGGYHHAKADSGEGFCVYADIPLAVHALWRQPQYQNLKVMVIDLDAHQGNGHEAIFKHDRRITIFDVYNADIYPHDTRAKQYITFDYPVRSGISDDEYLELIRAELPNALDFARPDLIIYNAGTDVYEKDPLGRMQLSVRGIIERDAFVFDQAKKNNTPLLMVLSGGYTQESANIIGESLVSILEHAI